MLSRRRRKSSGEENNKLKKALFRKYRLATTWQLYEKVGILAQQVGIMRKTVGKLAFNLTSRRDLL